MCFVWGKNWGFISQKTAFFIVSTVETSNLTMNISVDTFSPLKGVLLMVAMGPRLVSVSTVA
jgi:hypothetical protein